MDWSSSDMVFYQKFLERQSEYEKRREYVDLEDWWMNKVQKGVGEKKEKKNRAGQWRLLTMRRRGRGGWKI